MRIGPGAAQVRGQIVGRVGEVRTHTVAHGQAQVPLGDVVVYHKLSEKIDFELVPFTCFVRIRSIPIRGNVAANWQPVAAGHHLV